MAAHAHERSAGTGKRGAYELGRVARIEHGENERARVVDVVDQGFGHLAQVQSRPTETLAVIAHGGVKVELVGVMLQQGNHLQCILDRYSGIDPEQLQI